jgi:hypothetical protein
MDVNSRLSSLGALQARRNLRRHNGQITRSKPRRYELPLRPAPGDA